MTAVEQIEPGSWGDSLRIGIVHSRFNLPVCEALRDACVARLVALGVAESDMLIVTVPGALEIPLALQKMAETELFDGLVALGAVIRGETYHFELVSNESARGVTRVGLFYGIPIGNGILTTNTDAQAISRASTKGAEAAQAAIEMAHLAADLKAMAEEAQEEEPDWATRGR